MAQMPCSAGVFFMLLLTNYRVFTGEKNDGSVSF